MMGFRMETVRINAALLDVFEQECRKRKCREGYVDPNLNDFIDYALGDHMEEYFKEFPIVEYGRS